MPDKDVNFKLQGIRKDHSRVRSYYLCGGEISVLKQRTIDYYGQLGFPSSDDRTPQVFHSWEVDTCVWLDFDVINSSIYLRER